MTNELFAVVGVAGALVCALNMDLKSRRKEL